MSGDERLRTDYSAPLLEAEGLDDDPLVQWKAWLDAAFEAQVAEPHAACLSTVASDGRPSGRMVLVRPLDETSVAFFTNYGSRKAQELAANVQASLTFYWPALHRQVRIEGRVERVSEAVSDAYFASRPYDSQVASAASPQSRVIQDRTSLERRMAGLRDEHPESVPRPPDWGGFRLVPDVYEFWQGQPARLHDRFRYTRAEGAWTVERLAP